MASPHSNATKSALDPWPVIVAGLCEIDSFEILRIVSSSGIAVDWSLTDREDYSHKYRRNAYLPRINQAYERLSGDDRLRVAFIICEELVRRGLGEKLDADLNRIGWSIGEGALTPNTSTVRELFFPHGSQHDAYVQIRGIVRSAKRSIRIIDPYLDGAVFTILSGHDGPLKVELLAARLPPDLMLEAAKFGQQHQTIQIEVRQTRDFHDRFVIIDETEFWHIGCSIKDAGNKAFMLSRIEDAQNVESLINALHRAWNNAILDRGCRG